MKRLHIALLLLLIMYSYSYAAIPYTISPSKIVPGTPVVITFLLETTIKKIDDVIFELTDNLELGEYRIVPQASEIFFTVTLIPKKAGSHALLRVHLKSKSVTHTYDIGAEFVAEGVIAVTGFWKGPKNVYHYEPCILELHFNEPVNKSVYSAVYKKMQNYSEAVQLKENTFLVITPSSFKIPQFDFETTADEANSAVTLHITTAPFEIPVKEVPKETSIVLNENDFTYIITSDKEVYNSGERIVIDILIQGTGMPANLHELILTIAGKNGFLQTIPIALKKSYKLLNNKVQSTITGTYSTVLQGYGAYTIQAWQIPVFSVKTQTLSMLAAGERTISVVENFNNSDKLSSLKQFLSQNNNSSWNALLNNTNANYAHTLLQLQNHQYPWWSKDYATRIAFAIIAGDNAYAKSQIIEAERKGFPILLPLLYPVYTTLYYKLPHPIFFFIPLVTFLVFFGFYLTKYIRSKKRSHMMTLFGSICLILFLLLSVAVYERTLVYGVIDNCPVYKVPDTQASMITVGKAGDVIKILNTASSWYYIDYQGQRGWIQTKGVRYTTR